MAGTPLPLSKLTGGINLFEQECGPDQCAGASDVWERYGDLMRRPALLPIATGSIYELPSGYSHCFRETPFNTFSTDLVAFSASDVTKIGGTNGRLWIGCSVPFDGAAFNLHAITNAGAIPTTLTANKKVVVKYRNTSGTLVVAHGVVDTTSKREAATGFAQPLMQTGNISWHRSQFTAWTATTLNSVTAYWIAIDVSSALPIGGETDPAVGALSGSGSLTGRLLPFLLTPINGLCSVKIHGHQSTLCVGADLQAQRSRAPGGGLGFIHQTNAPTEAAFIPSRQGSGAIGLSIKPAWSFAGASAGTFGSAGTLTKTDQSFKWGINEFKGTTFLTFTCDAGSTSSRIITAAITAALGTTNFEGCILEAGTARTGIAVGDYREIASSDTTGVTVQAFGGTPSTGDTFILRYKGPWVKLRELGGRGPIFSNTAHVADLSFRPSSYGENIVTTGYYNFQIGYEAQWQLRAGRHWHFCFNPVTGNVLMTNGQNSLLQFDGYTTKYLTALFDDTAGVEGADAVSQWTGNLATVALELGDPNITLGNQLRRSPPNADLLAFYRGHVVVTLREDPTTIQWSAPNQFNDIWPIVYSTRIRDSQNNPVTGLFTLNEQLIAATATGIHAAQPPGADNFLVFSPVAQGIGFVNQESVATVSFKGSSVLVGPNADGIYAFTGASPIAILDSWKRILADGINARGLVNSCGAAWQQETFYFLAVPSSGSNVNDKIIVMDYGDPQAIKFWVWNAPFGGVTSIARDFDSTGKERILFGTQDGHICILANMPRDGNATITGTAKSPPINFQGQTMAFTGIRSVVEEIGSTPNFLVRTYIDSDKSRQTITKAVQAGGALYGTGLYGTATYADRKLVTYTSNLRAGGTDPSAVTSTNLAGLVRATTGETFQYEIESTALFKFRSATLTATPKGIRMK